MTATFAQAENDCEPENFSQMTGGWNPDPWAALMSSLSGRFLSGVCP
jgi:hypothetical protein